MALNEKEQVIALLTPQLEGLGFELADAVVSRYKANVLVRVFVYGQNGVTIADCASLSRPIGEALDGTEMFPGGYALEVSSPGLDRPLTSLRDFRYRVGEMVRVNFVDSGRKQITAQIAGIDDDKVEFAGETGPVFVPVAQIANAKIVL